MKTILIAWFVMGSADSTESVTVEFDSMQACQEAGRALETLAKEAKGANPRWNIICTPKYIEEPQ